MSTFTAAGRDSMHDEAKAAQVPAPTGLIDRCKRINEKLGRALALTTEIGGQYYGESKTAELDAKDLASDLLSWVQVMDLKANNLVTQLECMKEQF